ncbi:MAG: helix-turn-helix domain-containing protein [Faecalibacterium sp.]|jgi:transcriptional regulator with XRE-family HTH domain|uniref:helix-turn-helix domain-containing protein n=1 Tax=Faecalibacterium sp. TaxID=1971605 RepID=UPI00399C0E91
MKATLMDLVEALTKDMSVVDMAQTALHIEISRTIRNARKQKGLSQKGLAEKMGVKQSLVSRWESSECNYTIDTLVEIADALGLSVRCPLTSEEVKVSTEPIELKPAGRKVAFPKATFSGSVKVDLRVADGSTYEEGGLAS